MRGRNFHVFAVFGHRAPGDIDTFGLQQQGDLFIGERLAAILFLDHLFHLALEQQQRCRSARGSLHCFREEIAQLEHALRYFFSEAVQGPSGGATPLLPPKRKVKKMIEEEDRSKPLTDEQITLLLQAEGINVTRRTVAKYREDMKIPSTHQRRVRN